MLELGGAVMACGAMPQTVRDIVDLIGAWQLEWRFEDVYLEKVHAGPVMSKPAAFTFGKNVGYLEAALTICRARWVEVSPRRWMQDMGVLSAAGHGAKLGKKDKNINKARAQALFPTLHVTHAIADALLIAEYARRRVSSLGRHTDTDHATGG